jgi:hypoxanthine-guanine phosphoribosyltransferase
VSVCTFLHKRDVSGHLDPEYVGFSIPSDFVVGYGLDLAGRYRNLPFLAAVKDQQA